MWFLLLQIFLLLALAAVFGALVAWWWMKRRYEDVTSSHEHLLSRLSQLDELAKLARRDEMKAGLATLGASVAAIKPTDLTPVQDRLASLESAITAIRMPDLAPLEQRIAPIDERLMRIEERIGSLHIPEVDLGPVHSGIAALDLAIGRLESPAGRIGVLEAKLEEFADLLDAGRKSDADAVSARLAGLERTVAATDKPPLDLGPIHNRFFALQTALAAVQDQLRSSAPLEPIERRLAALQEALQSIPEPDLSPVLGVVHSIDRRLDVEATENRLTAIEYGLAAVHHMLRSRLDGFATRPETVASLRPAEAAPDEPALPPPPKPPRDIDPINPFRRPGDQANLLLEPAFGQPDDLEQIGGVGPMLEALLNEIGVFYCWQVAEWTPEDAAWVESKLMHFRGRIMRDDWIGRARVLAAQSMTAKRPMVDAHAGEHAAE